MKKTNQNSAARESAAALRMDYLMAASWYWLRAEGPDENLVSSLNRMKAQDLAQRFAGLSLALPTPEETYSYAQERWPQYKLHPLETL
jgi:hypothetical protein